MTINNNELGVNSVCSTSLELIQSDDFQRGVDIILKKTKHKDADKISKIFKDLAREEDELTLGVRLGTHQKETLYNFVREPQVVIETKKLLEHLATQSLPASSKSLSDGHQEYTDFMELMTNITGITSDNGYAALTDAIGEVADESLGILNIKKDAILVDVFQTKDWKPDIYNKDSFLDKLEQFYHATDQSDLIQTDLPVIQDLLTHNFDNNIRFFYEDGGKEDKPSGYRITFVDPDDNPSGNVFKGILVDKKGKIIDSEDKMKWLL